MRLGINLPQIGPATTAGLLAQAAERAETLGYDSLWAWERLLAPVAPQTPYPGSADGKLPAGCSHAWDPLTILTFVAARTRRVALGTSVLDIPYQNPVVLARALTTLDHLSNGRVRLGLGVGWSKDEFDAVGSSLGERGARADEFLDVLRAIWTTDPVEFHGRFYRIPRSVIGLKPVQKPHPPVYLATYVQARPRQDRQARRRLEPGGPARGCDDSDGGADAGSGQGRRPRPRAVGGDRARERGHRTQAPWCRPTDLLRHHGPDR